MNGTAFATALMLCSAFLAGNFQAKKKPRLADYVGCYTVTLSAWKGNAGLDSSTTTPPPSVELTAARVAEFKTTEMYWVKPGPTAKADSFAPFSFWRITPQGEVSITLSRGFQGMSLTLSPKGAALVGTARASGDVSPDELYQVAGARADRMDCRVRK